MFVFTAACLSYSAPSMTVNLVALAECAHMRKPGFRNRRSRARWSHMAIEVASCLCDLSHIHCVRLGVCLGFAAGGTVDASEVGVVGRELLVVLVDVAGFAGRRCLRADG